MAFLQDIWDISIPGQRIAQARDLRAQRAAMQEQRDREAAAYQAIQNGDVMGAAAQSPEIAGAYGNVQAGQDDLRRQAGLRLTKSLRAASQKLPWPQAVELVGRASGQFFGGDEESRQAVMSELLQGGPAALDAIEAALSTSTQQQAQLPAALQIYDRYKGLSPEDRRLFQESQRAPTVREAGGRVFQIGPDGQTFTLQGVDQTAAGEYQVKSAGAQGAATGKAAGEIAAEDLPRSERETRRAAASIADREQRLNLVESTIDEAIGQANAFTTGIGSLTAAVPGTPAANLAANLATIEANVGFDELQRLRDMSPTGGALGQVSERENVLLQSVLSALRQSQGPEQFKKNLQRVKKQVRESWQRVADAYEADFGQAYTGAVPGAGGEGDVTDLLSKYGIE